MTFFHAWPEWLKISAALPVVAFTIYLWIQAATHMIGMQRNMRVSIWLASLLGPFVPFCSFLFTPQGNEHRRQFLLYAGAFTAICVTPFAGRYVVGWAVGQ
ncbi:MAG: hypothetical protein WC809_11945 [Sinimarinibacterium sp.]